LPTADARAEWISDLMEQLHAEIYRSNLSKKKKNLGGVDN
jgi:hypothetical protein